MAKDIVVIILRFPNGKLAVQRRDNKARRAPNLLTFFGGHVEAGESYRAAIKRELSEETSLHVTTLRIRFVASVGIPFRENPKRIAIREHVFETSIPYEGFEVYEGTGAEAYNVSELRARTDLAPDAQYLLSNDIV